MAHAALTAKPISRNKGRSAVAAAAYRSGEKLRDDRSGKLHDYTRKTGIEATGIEAPDHAPDWARDRGQLWNRVEATERRKDAQLAREVVLVLPRGLDERQRRELVQGFSRDAFVQKGMVADWAIHAPEASDGDKNYHAHIMLTTRDIEGDELGQKNRQWNKKSELHEWRKLYEDHSNRHLAAAGSSYRVDLRSNRAKGIDRQPQSKRGIPWHRLKREAIYHATNPRNPLTVTAAKNDIQEKYFEIVWGREWAWEGYEAEKDPGGRSL